MRVSAEQVSAIVVGPTPDEEIVERVLAGSLDLFEVLMRRHNQRVYRAIRGLLRDESEVEDAMQQVYLAAFAHLREFKRDARFSTWLIRIAINEALARLRRRGRFVAVAEVPEDVEMSGGGGDDGGIGIRKPVRPDESAASRELLGWLERAVDALPEPYRVVFMLREVEGMDTAQTAEALKVSELVVKTRLHRAKERLREAMRTHLDLLSTEAFSFAAPRCDRVVARVLAALPRSP